LDADADDFISFIVEGAKRMQTLINDLLDYSRAGRVDAVIGDVNCEEVLRDVVESMSVVVRETQAVITHDALPVVRGNEKNYVLIFKKLIENAIRFHGAAPPLIHVSARLEKNEWLFSVNDNGIGIESQYFDRIFLIFQRLHSRDQYPGNGIGLAICKKLVDIEGGNIWVESQPGTGSTFYFTIPKL